jgi:hypothetical protein
MKYMLLIQGNKEEWDAFEKWSEQDMKAMNRYMDRINQDLMATGEWVEGNGLTGPANMKTVIAQPSADPLITDGPYPESKEVLAGYWIVDVASVERAVELAHRISQAPGANGEPSCQKVEVHPVGEGPVV